MLFGSITSYDGDAHRKHYIDIKQYLWQEGITITISPFILFGNATKLKAPLNKLGATMSTFNQFRVCRSMSKQLQPSKCVRASCRPSNQPTNQPDHSALPLAFASEFGLG